MIQVNIEKARAIAHDKRRQARAVEFAPLDIEATIPALADQAEQKRAAVRAKYAAMQLEIDQAGDLAKLKKAMGIE